jgi:M6 family metalloprotease-like protein
VHRSAQPVPRLLPRILLAAALALVAAAAFSPHASAAAKPACTPTSHSTRILALNVFKSDMKPARAAFFRHHKSRRARRAFLRRQQRTLTSLRRGARSCGRSGSSGVADTVPDPVPPPCSPSLFSAPYTEMNEGTTNAALPLRPNGAPVRAVMLFVDFPDLQTSEATSIQYNRLVPRSRRWFTEVSYGRLSLDVTPLSHWVRMPHSVGWYGLANGISWKEHHDYIADAVHAADDEVDFSRYQVVYIVAPKNIGVDRSPAFQAYPGSGIPADGTELRFGSTFFDDTRFDARYAANVLIHETGHVLGLPDLYDVPNPTYWSLFRFAGGWDMMSWNDPGGHFLAWEKWKLGWLDPSQLTCLDSPGEVTTTVTPLERAGGLKAIVVPTGISSAWVIEARKKIGEDAPLCEDGVLVYKVDASVHSGYGPVQVSAAQRDTNTDLRNRCGPLYNAPYDKKPGEVAGFRDDAAGLSVQVLSSGANGYRVRVSRTTFASRSFPLTTMITAGSTGGAVQEGAYVPPQATYFPFGTGWDLNGPPDAD